MAVRRALWVTYALSIALLCLLPSRWIEPAHTPSYPPPDKAAHLLMYGILGHLTCWALLKAPSLRAILMTAGGCILYGVLLEVLQLSIPSLARGFSWLDIAANIVGTSLGIAGWLLWRRHAMRRQPASPSVC